MQEQLQCHIPICVISCMMHSLSGTSAIKFWMLFIMANTMHDIVLNRLVSTEFYLLQSNLLRTSWGMSQTHTPCQQAVTHATKDNTAQCMHKKKKSVYLDLWARGQLPDKLRPWIGHLHSMQCVSQLNKIRTANIDFFSKNQVWLIMTGGEASASSLQLWCTCCDMWGLISPHWKAESTNCMRICWWLC